MKEELTNLVNKYSWSKSGNDYKKIIEAIEKYDRYIFRLNLEAQRYFDMLMDKIYGKVEIIEEDKPIEKITIDLNYANHYSKANEKLKKIEEYLEEYIVDLQQEKKQLEELLDKIKYETECLKNSFDDEDEVFEDFERIINLFPKGDE